MGFVHHRREPNKREMVGNISFGAIRSDLNGWRRSASGQRSVPNSVALECGSKLSYKLDRPDKLIYLFVCLLA